MLDPTFEFVPADPMPPAIAVLRNTAEPVWIFAYGSLMWDEDFPRAETETALLRGYHRRDARAVAEEAGRGNEAAVRIKSEAAQATRALMRVRERRIRQRVQTANQLRGLLNQFGIILPKGHQMPLMRLRKVMATAEFAALPAVVRELAQTLRAEIAEQAEKVRAPARL